MSGGTLTKVKSPLVFETTTGSCVPRVSLVIATVAPGMTAPCASLTVPVSVPVVTCAATGRARIASAIAATARRATLLLLLMSLLLVTWRHTGASHFQMRQRWDEYRGRGTPVNAAEEVFLSAYV